MKIVRCQTAAGPRYGMVTGEVVRLLSAPPFGKYRLEQEITLDQVRLLAPCEPTKIVAVGINYNTHAQELAFDIPAAPLLFLKPPSAVIGPGAAIVLPPMSRQVEYEGELAAVIGRRAKNIREAEALDHVLGFTCLNDVTARDLQKLDGQFTRAKGFDTFAPLGPWIETDLTPDRLHLETRVNGERRQAANTGDMLRSTGELVSFISQVMTLEPGDVLATGTPAGVGPLRPGDTVAVNIEKIGTLTNKVVNA
jgi:2-keto-4-pentenoate hydratase/2-oxohepta-3-ene-1,7-dioic acid hydratase in catechol pathway